MEVELAYGKSSIKLQIPDEVEVDTFAPVSVSSPVSFEQFKAEFGNANGDRLINAANILFIVNDGYRNTPTSQILDWLNRLDARILDRSQFLISTGTHDHPSDAHLRTIFGQYYDRLASRISVHDSGDLASMRVIGKDRSGESVYLNSVFCEADRVCIIGSVEPHYFAGFTGGRKSLIPGLADFKTIERNHNLANSLEAMPMRLAGNPVAEHLADLMKLVDTSICLSILFVMDSRQQIAGLFIGELHESFERAAAFAERVFGHRVAHRYDSVICEVLPPLDNNLYQAQKGLENCQQAVIDGGTAVVVSACAGGVGSAHFWDLANGWNEAENRPGDGQLTFGSHKLSRVNLMRRRITPAIYCGLSDEQVRRVFYEPVGDLTPLIRPTKREYSIAIVHDAGNTVLRT